MNLSFNGLMHNGPQTMKLTIIKMTVYVPGKDFEEAKRFYNALGFELVEGWNGNYDCSLGAARFRLQKYFVEDWANNFMMQFWVDDVDAWYEHANQVITEGKFDARTKAPEIIDGTKVCHVIDPSGVLLIFLD